MMKLQSTHPQSLLANITEKNNQVSVKQHSKKLLTPTVAFS